MRVHSTIVAVEKQ